MSHAAKPLGWRVALLLVLLGTTTLVLAGCQLQRGAAGAANVEVDLAVSPEPPAEGPATLTIDLRTEDGEPLIGATVRVEGNMSHAGMKPVLRDAVEQGDGRYAVEDFAFTMPGDWFIIVSGTLDDGTAFEERVDVPGVSGSSAPMQHDVHGTPGGG